jgi:photosystem II stability/assembly factor-like uncharacterized protein
MRSRRRSLAALLLSLVAALGLVAARGPAVAAPSLTSGWTAQPVPQLNGRPPILYSVYAYDAQTIWAGGAQGPANVALYAEILKSVDGGRTWTIQYAPPVCCEVLQIVADSPQRATALQSTPSGGRLLTTYDGGATWAEAYATGSGPQLWGLAATAAGYTWAVGASGRIVYRYPGETVIRPASVPTGSTLWATAAAPRSATGWAVGDSGIVLKTLDGGASWAVQAYIINDTLTAVAAASPDVAWVVGTKGAIFKTVNGGESWFRQYPQNTVNFNGVAAGSTEVAWLVAGVEGGVVNISATADGGASWRTQYRDDSIASDRLIGAITAASPSEAWAVSTGQILHTSTGGQSAPRTYLPLVPRD